MTELGEIKGEELELRREAGGLRYYLAGEPVHAGEILELRLADGTWLPGRYEWGATEGTMPRFYVSENKVLRLSSGDTLRWPRRY